MVSTSNLLRGLFSLVSWLLIAAAVVTGTIWCWNGWHGAEILHPPGILVRDDPVQIDFSPTALTTVGEWNLTRLATFHIVGRVLCFRRYRDDRSSLAPIDIALGWGTMSDTNVLKALNFSQSSRMFFREFDGAPPIPENEIGARSANLHIIPADVEVAAFIDKLSVGQLIDLRGSLVVASNGNTVWRSSLKRGDVGPNSGELFYVTQALSFRVQSDIVADEGGRVTVNSHTSLQSWFEVLQLRRRNLNLRDPQAVRAYNEEARRYMAVAHPERAPGSPVGAPSATAEPFTGKPKSR